MTAHAILRARERYGLTLTPADIEAIAGLCATDGTLLVSRDGERQTEQHALKWQGVSVICVYRADRHAIVTFLPADALALDVRKKRRRARYYEQRAAKKSRKTQAREVQS